MAQAGPFGKQDPSTAELLGAYRRELEAQGIEPYVAEKLVLEAARQVLRDSELVVKADTRMSQPDDTTGVEHFCDGMVQAAIAYRALQELFVETTGTPEDRLRRLWSSYPTPDDLRKRVEE